MPIIQTELELLALVALLAYLLGSIPFGIVITRALGLGDLRAIGSGNIGATNVLRTGGKGVATFLGTLIALAWPVGLAACGTWLVVAVISRISSLSALVAAALSSLWLLVFDRGQMLLLVVALTVLVYIRHWANLQRIKAGTEPKIGAKKA